MALAQVDSHFEEYTGPGHPFLEEVDEAVQDEVLAQPTPLDQPERLRPVGGTALDQTHRAAVTQEVRAEYESMRTAQERYEQGLQDGTIPNPYGGYL